MPRVSRISYLDGPRLRRSLLAACRHAQASRAELNRINVFPVPDGDTGTNLALTLRAIADELVGNRDPAVSQVAREAAQAAILGARGNCGMMLSHFLVGFSESLEGSERATPEELAGAMEGGVARLQEALENPVEGTILTVMRETAQAARASVHRDFALLIPELLVCGRESLERTPDLLPSLKRAGVVDAGAKGFVALLEGVDLYLRGERLGESGPAGQQDWDMAPLAAVDYPDDEGFRYCTEVLVRGSPMADRDDVVGALRPLGDSLIVLRSDDLLKVHIHTDEPQRVFELLRAFGTVASHKAEDMRAQHAVASTAEKRGHGVTLARRPFALVTDSAADLPADVVRGHGIHVVPLALLDGDQVLRDGVEIGAVQFADRLVAGGGLPTTSQPAPGDFLRAFEAAAEEGEHILAVLLGATLSGTFGSAEAASARFGDAPVTLVDSRAASLLEGLLVLRAAELAEAGESPERIVERLSAYRDRSGLMFTVAEFDRLLASGRVSPAKVRLARFLGLRPILELDREGRVRSAGRAFGPRRAIQKLLSQVEGAVRELEGRPRFGIIHVACPEIVPEVRDRIRARFGDVEILEAPATPVIATHLGPGAWGLAYSVEEPGG